jgi:hypothetical protein
MSPTRLVRILTILAMLVAPLGMMGGHAAMAMPVSAQPAMDHMAAMSPGGSCADMDKQPEDQSGPGIDCMIACSAVPSAEGGIAGHPLAAADVQPPPPSEAASGLHPESDPPPPRFA